MLQLIVALMLALSIGCRHLQARCCCNALQSVHSRHHACCPLCFTRVPFHAHLLAPSSVRHLSQRLLSKYEGFVEEGAGADIATGTGAAPSSKAAPPPAKGKGKKK